VITKFNAQKVKYKRIAAHTDFANINPGMSANNFYLEQNSGHVNISFGPGTYLNILHF
jgi:hypothetical protein